MAYRDPLVDAEPAQRAQPLPSGTHSLQGTGGRKKDAVIQCLKYNLWSRNPALRGRSRGKREEGAGNWG